MGGYNPRVEWSVDEVLRRCRQEAGGCLTWLGCTQKGYGSITTQGRQVRAHRLIYELLHGPIPEGLMVMHTCDNPPCCNPAHLVLGTNADNMRDAAAKGRNGSQRHPETRPRGERHHKAKLTAAQVQEIRRLRAQGVIYRELAASFGISIAQAAKVAGGQFWTHV